MENDRLLILFGQRVRDLRKANGMSQEALGLEVDLEQAYISDIERGLRNVGLKSVHAIAHALGVTLAELLEGVD